MHEMKTNETPVNLEEIYTCLVEAHTTIKILGLGLFQKKYARVKCNSTLK